MIVFGSRPVNFNYATFDQQSGLFIAAKIFEVTTGTPVFLATVPMVDLENGVYVGSFTPVKGHSYLIMSTSWTDNTYTTPDPNRSPAVDQYDAFDVDTTAMGFNYGTYDYNPALTINATVFDLTTNTQATVSMVHVGFGVYWGRYVGDLFSTYTVVKVPTDVTRSPGCDSFQCFPMSYEYITNIFSSATLTGQSLNALLRET